MIFNTEILMVKKDAESSRKPMTPEQVERYKAHYLDRLHYYGYIIDNQNRSAVNKIAESMGRFIAYENEQKEKPKGLFIFGSCGTGKSLAMQLFSGMFRIEFVSAPELTRHYASFGEGDFWDWGRRLNQDHLIIDDLGAERDLKSFGNESIMRDFLFEREKAYKERGKLTFITSNFKSREELAEKYDERIKSRILSMCDPVMLNGNDRRLITK